MKKRQKNDADIAPGDDVCPTPDPVNEEPPADRFCDLVLTGGVASGVVYPWAIVELARAFRFRNIGGTSVGAMAAALAAAAEYGRRNGFAASFEPLRLTPAALAEGLPDGRTRMLSLFQANQRGKRLIKLWGRLGRGERKAQGQGGFRFAFEVLRAFAWPCILGGLAGFLLAAALSAPYDSVSTVGVERTALALTVLLVLIGATLGLLWAVWSDIHHGLIANGLGLCKGGTLEPDGPEGKRPGLSEWLHNGIQLSAGLKKTDRPLTFRDLWNAPEYPGAAPKACGDDDPVFQRSINLQVFTTNVTHGRPYRLPLIEENSRLFFRRDEWKEYFPPVVLDALVKVSRPYAPRSTKEPKAGQETAGLLQLPCGDLPLVVAARLSLSFPLLFSAVPLWAIDYEAPAGQRTLKRCQFTDGGASSNFPIHLFDAALPRWPTFGMWLDRQDPYRHKENVWLPDFQGKGWGDNWNRFDPAAGLQPALAENYRTRTKFLWGFLRAMATGAVDWRDRTSFRLPHVRNRVARLLLRPGEGGLHIGMPRKQILEMAHRYGTEAGRKFVERFAGEKGQATQPWSEQRWVRMEVLIRGLRERLTGLSTSAVWATHTVPMTEAIERSVREGPILDRGDCNQLNQDQADSLAKILGELENLESLMRAAEPQRFKPVPDPELRLRAPL